MTKPKSDGTANNDAPGSDTAAVGAGLDADALAKLAHEMRQPLHAMGLFIDNLRDLGLTPRQAELLDRMDEALELSCRLVEKMKPEPHCNTL